MVICLSVCVLSLGKKIDQAGGPDTFLTLLGLIFSLLFSIIFHAFNFHPSKAQAINLTTFPKLWLLIAC